jgi:hypothetical protein
MIETFSFVVLVQRVDVLFVLQLHDARDGVNCIRSKETVGLKRSPHSNDQLCYS